MPRTHTKPTAAEQWPPMRDRGLPRWSPPNRNPLCCGNDDYHRLAGPTLTASLRCPWWGEVEVVPGLRIAPRRHYLLASVTLRPPNGD